jgi:hypothetical protein
MDHDLPQIAFRTPRRLRGGVTCAAAVDRWAAPVSASREFGRNEPNEVILLRVGELLCAN